MRILVTGADGFVGQHLGVHLRARGDDVVEVRGPRAEAWDVRSHSVDVTQADQVMQVVEAAAPQAVVHLAGFSSVARSHQHPGRAFAVNTLGTVNVLAAVRAHAPRARVLLVGSGEVYGPVPPGERATEDFPLNPTSPYAASKVAAELAGLQFHRSYGLEVVLARPFNHLGAAQDPTFVVPGFAAQLRAILRREAEPVLRVGNLDPVRDFSHVHDVVEAYRLLLEKGEPGRAYNICSGEGRTIRSVLDQMVRIAGAEVRVELDPARLRPSDLPSLVGDSTRLRDLGWAPKRTLQDALEDVLQHEALQPSADAPRG